MPHADIAEEELSVRDRDFRNTSMRCFEKRLIPNVSIFFIKHHINENQIISQKLKLEPKKIPDLSFSLF